MSCQHSNNCTYYRTYRYKPDSRQYKLLVDSYCEGRLQQNCRRLEYQSVYSKEAPESLAPNGYLIGTHNKIRIEDTRKHKRYQVKDCVCLLQVVDSKRTFSAWMIDISEGGLRLELNIDPEDLELCTKSNHLKILGCSKEKRPVSPNKDTLKMAWQNKRLLGCYFVAA